MSTQLLRFYPQIIKLRKVFFTYREIAETLINQHNIAFNSKNPENQIANFVRMMQKGKLNEKFTNYQLINLINLNEEMEYEKIALEIDVGLYVTYSSISIDKNLLVTRDNIMDIPTIKGAVIAKWILRIYDISDEQFIEEYKSNFEKKYNKKLDLIGDSQDFINNSYENSVNSFKNISYQLKQKFANLKESNYEKILSQIKV